MIKRIVSFSLILFIPFFQVLGQNTIRENSKSITQSTPIQLVRLQLGGQSYTDETVVYTDSTATMGFDGQYDAEKVPSFPPAPTFASLDTSGLKLSINAIPPLALQTTIPLSVVVHVSGTWTITATQLDGFQPGDDVILDDTQLNVQQSLLQNPIYSFTFNENDPEGRFFLNLIPSTITGIENEPSFSIWYDGTENTVKFGQKISDLEKFEIYDVQGKLIYSNHTKLFGINAVKLNKQLPQGIYILAIQTKESTFVSKFFANSR